MDVESLNQRPVCNEFRLLLQTVEVKQHKVETSSNINQLLTQQLFSDL